LTKPIDLYTSTHKGQRLKFSEISNAAGTLNINDQNKLNSLEVALVSFRDHMYKHASLEEKFIHPLLAERVPGGADRLEEDHRVMHKQFENIVACFGELKKKLTDFEQRDELSLEFYRAWSRFISFYLDHIDFEEDHVMPLLWKLCTDDELAGRFRQIVTDLTPNQLMYNLEIILPALNPAERFMTLKMGQTTMPTEAFQAVLNLAERVLSPEDWASLKAMLK
jgi:hemerythrin-like domain-containing protein